MRWAACLAVNLGVDWACWTACLSAACLAVLMVAHWAQMTAAWKVDLTVGIVVEKMEMQTAEGRAVSWADTKVALMVALKVACSAAMKGAQQAAM